MHNLAIALRLKGYEVSGSDDEIFDPAKSNLDRHGILPESFGWFPEKITPDLDAVILGMHAKHGNPELDKALSLGLKIYSFPEYLYEQSKNKTRVVIAGSHGKTTITSMVMHVMRHAGMDFDYLVGARIEGFDIMVRLSDAPVIVIEGDEYLTSALDPRPKFLHYHPHIALISGIAWDHINVFPDFEGYVQQFANLMHSIEKEGSLVYCREDDLLEALVEKERPGVECIPYQLPPFSIDNGITSVHTASGERVPLLVFGKHNLMNTDGARQVCRKLGISDQQFDVAIRGFTGASNRLQLLAGNQDTAVYKDFAHAPSKLRATVDAVKMQYPGRRLIAAMELHTYSSLSKDFLEQYHATMDPADVAVVFFNPHAIALKKLLPITPEDVMKGFGRSDLQVFTDAAELRNFLSLQNYANTNLLLMSSGNFGGMDVSQLAVDVVRQ